MSQTRTDPELFLDWFQMMHVLGGGGRVGDRGHASVEQKKEEEFDVVETRLDPHLSKTEQFDTVRT